MEVPWRRVEVWSGANELQLNLLVGDGGTDVVYLDHIHLHMGPRDAGMLVCWLRLLAPPPDHQRMLNRR